MSSCPQPLSEASLPTSFCAHSLPVDLSKPRSILFSGPGPSDFLTLERGRASISHVFDSNGDGTPDARTVVAETSGLNHGLALDGNGYVYASTAGSVYRWPWTTSSGGAGQRELVIDGIGTTAQGLGAPGGHTTRTLVFDEARRLYVSVGSAGNVDSDSYRSRIRRFDLSDESLFPLDFGGGEVFADGLRNEVGLAFDRHNVLWGVENGADNLMRDDLGGDIHDDNPAEELNRFPEEDAGRHWGYPYCFTEFSLPVPPGRGKGTVWAWPSFLNQAVDALGGAVVTDELCRNTTVFVPPEASMQAHSAPLGITFYQYQDPSLLPENCTGAFPSSMDGHAFVAFHGSWNRDPPTGYKVISIPMDDSGRVSGQPVDILRRASSEECAEWESGLRPVDVAFDGCGRLLVTSDGTKGEGDEVFRISFDGGTGIGSGACCGERSTGHTAGSSEGDIFCGSTSAATPPIQGNRKGLVAVFSYAPAMIAWAMVW